MNDKRYVPDTYLTKIHFRIPRKASGFFSTDQTLEPNFETWEDAHSHLVATRQARLLSTELRLKRDKQAVRKAERLKRFNGMAGRDHRG